MKRFDGLDGLRGVAAIAVMALHCGQSFGGSQNPLPNAPLAVDFFFMLSGFVLAHAYGHELEAGGLSNYLKARAIRVYPLIVAGTLLGALAAAIRGAGRIALLKMGAAGVLSLPFLASNPLGIVSVSPLDPPAWSLIFEISASVAFGFGVWRGRWLLPIVAVTALAFVYVMLVNGTMHVGFKPDSFGSGFVRMAYGFGAGVLLYKARPVLPEVHIAWPALALACVLLLPKSGFFLQSIVLFMVFPTVVIVGANSRGWVAASRLSGELSYPLYITHVPMLVLLGLALPSALWSLAVAVPVLFLSAFGASRLFDIPVRRKLNALAAPMAPTKAASDLPSMLPR